MYDSTHRQHLNKNPNRLYVRFPYTDLVFSFEERRNREAYKFPLVDSVPTSIVTICLFLMEYWPDGKSLLPFGSIEMIWPQYCRALATSVGFGQIQNIRQMKRRRPIMKLSNLSIWWTGGKKDTGKKNVRQEHCQYFFISVFQIIYEFLFCRALEKQIFW